MNRITILSRKEIDRRRRREEILSAAETVFAEKGYSGATMSEISHHAEYPLATIYKFFPGKEQIFRELVVDKCEDLARRLEAALAAANTPPLERLRRCLQVKASFFQENRVFGRLFLSVRGSLELYTSSALIPEVNGLMVRMRDHYTQAFEEAVAQGSIAPRPSRYLAAVFLDLTTAEALRWILEEDPAATGLEHRLETTFALFLDGARPRNDPRTDMPADSERDTPVLSQAPEEEDFLD